MLGILTFAVIPNFMNAWLANTLVGLGEIRRVAWFQVGLTVANITANLFVVPTSGARGAAWTTVATELVALTAYGLAVVMRWRDLRPGLAPRVVH